MTDQHRFDRLSCMGDPVLRTPNIDSIARAGVLFRNAYTPSPVCSPARAAIKSGMYPPGCGVVTNWVPFFLFTSFFGPHQPFEPPAPWNALYDPKGIQLPPQYGAEMQGCPIFEETCAPRARLFKRLWSQEAYGEMVAAYCGQVAMIDHCVGRLLDYLKREALWDDALVIFCSDHGDHNGAYGLFFEGQMYDSCCKVPLLIKMPGSADGGIVRDEIVNTLDLYGTILDMAGNTDWRQPHIEARSLVPLAHSPDSVAWENKRYAIIGADPTANLAMLRAGDLKLIRLSRGDGEPLYELYDMRDEPVETRNVFDDPHYLEGREKLKEELDARWIKQCAAYPDEIRSYAKT
jgi:arylsulfatase A-like enzyme